jgi:hypothetical protein
MPRRRNGLWLLVGLAVLLTVAAATPVDQQGASEITPATSPRWWVPAPHTTWQWQLTGPVDTSVDAQMYDVDLFDVSADVVSALHQQGRSVVCYMSAGTYEAWRPDAHDFPAAVLGASLGQWSGERWLDIRQLDALGPIMQRRLDLCQAKGFDGVELDNVDGYTNASGFPLNASDQLVYNAWLADQAHARGLSVGLKNDLEQIPELLVSFDWALDEQCFEYDECDQLQPFVQAGKAVFEVEYNLSPASFCRRATAMQFNAIRKNLALDVARTACG